ncbi:MAG: transport system ATP-binding/permease protein [Pyrinomonadaceae bacterium]|jgi:ABC-type multidrug transport system ATPase subunit/pSer/pThr/pTyr-binding forkhead associated (FHA) protein|nr:transport system ATP-binding/permease protein [Pyrinomonadaceae bacterium]
MKIYLSEETNGQLQPEREFDAATVRVGRDGSDCQIVFDGNEWPMVSRKHAEFRVESARSLLVDLQSRFGTLLDGRQLSAPAEIRAGSRVQFGPGGPVLVVVRIGPTQAALPSVQTPTIAEERIAPTSAYREPAFLELRADGAVQRFEIARDVSSIGRDTNMDIRIAADAGLVSRRHAVIKRRENRFELVDQDSFNGTLLNGQRIVAASLLSDGDRVQLGRGGPILHFRDPANPAPKRPDRESVPATIMAPVQQRSARSGPSAPPMDQRVANTGEQGAAVVHPFAGNAPLTIGRATDINVRLDGLQISNYHARVSKSNGAAFIEDAGSTNGVYVNGTRIKSKVQIGASDTVQIGPFLLLVDPERGVAVLDTRSKTRIDAIDITKIVPNRAGGGTIKLLDDVDLTIQPNEFVGLLGPSGAGKSTLMDALNGMRPATKGLVLVNSQDLYEHLDSLKQSIGYVPQDDIIHRELTVYRTLYYVARLRLSSDVSTQEIDQIINEVMDVTGLSERRDVPVGQLSGGQRKRVSIAVELITKPSIIYLDEPTSGLDPATEEKVMKLFRQIAESGRTVILTTHAMENVKLFDKIVVLMRGKLVFYGGPQAALRHVGADSFKDLYDKLEAPIAAGISKLPALPANASAEQKGNHKLQREQIAEEVAEEWKRRFTETEEYKVNILQPLGALKGQQQTAAPAKNRHTVTDRLRQWKTLAQRYIEVLRHDKFNLLILFGQAPIVAFLTYLVVDKESSRDFPFFVLALVSVWFGTSIAAREIIKERAVYNRERMVNLGLLPYVGSKLLVLTLIVGLQCILLFGSLRLLQLAGLMELPGNYYGVPQLLVMILTGMVGIALGLLVSAIVKTSEMATSFVPLLLIPQLLFCGLVGVPKGISKYVGVVMPATWSFDEMKRFSYLPVLRGKDEKGEPAAQNDGRGLYKDIKYQNDRLVDQKQKDVEGYKSKSEAKFDYFDKEMNTYQKDLEKWNLGGRRGTEPTKPSKPKLDPVPPQVKVVQMPDDLSGYVDFLHPWGDRWLNPAVLLLMFFGLTGGTILALRSQDIG